MSSILIGSQNYWSINYPTNNELIEQQIDLHLLLHPFRFPTRKIRGLNLARYS